MELAVVLALIVAACSSDDVSTTEPDPAGRSTEDSTSTTTDQRLPTSSSTSTPDGQSIEDQIIARYLGFWDARFEANSGTPNPDDPALGEFATGEQLVTVVAETRQRLDDGLALRAAEPSLLAHSVSVVSVGSDRAELQDCFVNDGIVYRVATGEVIDERTATRSVSVVMVLDEGAWKLQRATVIQEWEGIAGCALAD